MIKKRQELRLFLCRTITASILFISVTSFNYLFAQTPSERCFTNILFKLASSFEETDRVRVQRGDLISREILGGRVFSRIDFSKYAPFKFNEYVQIGGDLDSTMAFEIVDTMGNLKGGKIEFDKYSVPYIGKFIKVLDEDHYIVEVSSKLANVDKLNLKAPKEKVVGLISGRPEVVTRALAKLSGIKIKIKKGEPVRYRDKSGLMKTGIMVKKKGGEFLIKKSNNKIIDISQNRVFRGNKSSKAFTPKFTLDWMEIKMLKPRGVFAGFLDGAARISSHEKFSDLAPVEQIKILMSYTQSFVPWKKAANIAENAGIDEFEKLLCAGVSVCRHNSILLATVLSESGFKLRVVRHLKKDISLGHAWLEVDVIVNGRAETLIVDPSSRRRFAEPLWKVKKLSTESKDSMSALWYTDKGREYFFPEFFD